jgi:hypothetical protein
VLTDFFAVDTVGLAMVSTAGVLVTPIYNVPGIGTAQAGLLWGFAAAPVVAATLLG